MDGDALARMIVAGCCVAGMAFILMKSLEYFGDWMDGRDDDNGGE